jgi:Zn-dependent metalloprotease
MDHYVAGGDVHINSGIPNRAFYMVATALGGHAWDAAGRIWYATLTNSALAANATFTDFAKLTVQYAQHTYGVTSNEATAVKGGWDAVKVPLA